jgi:multicomponent Na+:H+ antiporter subunit D
MCADSALFWKTYTEGIQIVRIGNWPAPYGITLVSDLFSAIMIVLTGLMAAIVGLYSVHTIDKGRISFGYFPMLHLLLMGVSGSFLTGDLFNMFVWFEVMLIASFVLMVLGGERPQLEGAIKYVTLNLLASIMFLSAVGILYGKVGTLNLADLSVKLRDMQDPGFVTALSMLFVVAFGIKAGVFPLFFWLPASYHTPPIAVTTIFSGLLTKVGVYAMVRMFTLVFTQDPAFNQTVFLWIAGLTMVTGVLGAVAQYDVRRLLSFHIISQIGYLVMGLAIGTSMALAALVYFMVHVVFAKSALFLVAGVAHRIRGQFALKQLGGLYDTRPGLAVLFLVAALSLAGIPPLSGFFAKLLLIRAGLEAGHYTIVATALVVSVLTLYSMVKIWTEAFWKSPPGIEPEATARDDRTAGPMWSLYTPIAVLVVFIAVLGILTEPAYLIAHEAAIQLLDPSVYTDAVLGGLP